MTVVEWVKTVQDVGFPILIVIYILFRLNKTFIDLNKLLER